MVKSRRPIRLKSCNQDYKETRIISLCSNPGCSN